MGKSTYRWSDHYSGNWVGPQLLTVLCEGHGYNWKKEKKEDGFSTCRRPELDAVIILCDQVKGIGLADPQSEGQMYLEVIVPSTEIDVVEYLKYPALEADLRFSNSDLTISCQNRTKQFISKSLSFLICQMGLFSLWGSEITPVRHTS